MHSHPQQLYVYVHLKAERSGRFMSVLPAEFNRLRITSWAALVESYGTFNPTCWSLKLHKQHGFCFLPSPVTAFHRTGWRTYGLVCPAQLLLLPLLHDECHGSHLHPKAEINLAYNTPPVWQARLRKMSVSAKARTTAARPNILPLCLHPPLTPLDCPVGLFCSSSRPVVREDRDLLAHDGLWGIWVFVKHNWALEFYWGLRACVYVCVSVCAGLRARRLKYTSCLSRYIIVAASISKKKKQVCDSLGCVS